MARIPIPRYEPLGPRAATPRLPMSDPTGGVQVARALVAIGAGMDERAAQADRQAQAQAEQQARADAARALAAFQATRARTRLEARSGAPAAAAGHADTLKASFETQSAQLLDGIADPVVRGWAQTRLIELRSDEDVAERGWEAGQRVDALVQNVRAGADLAANALALEPTPEAWATARQTQLELIDALVLPDAAKAALRTQTRQVLGESYVRALADRDPVEARAVLASGALSADVTADQFAQLSARVESELAQREALQRAEARARAADAADRAREQRALLGDRLEDFQSQLRSGQPVDPRAVAAASEAAVRLGRPELARSLQEMGRANAITTAAERATPAQLQAEINTLNGVIATGGTAQDRRDRATLEAVQARMTAGLRADPLSWAARAGAVQLAPVDLRDPASVRARLDAGAQVRARYGVAAGPWTQAERSGLLQQINAAKPAEKLALATSLGAALGAQAAPALMALGDRNFAWGALLAQTGHGAAAAAKAFTGQALLRAGNKLLPSQTDLSDATSDVLGTAFGALADSRATAIQIATFIYANEASKRGLAPTEFRRDLWERSLNEAVGARYEGTERVSGGVHRWRDQMVVLPPALSADAFEDALARLTPAVAARLNGGKPVRTGSGADVTPAFLRRARLVDLGAGRYALADAAGRMLPGAGAGGLFVLDVAALARLTGVQP
jgi:hypothetical protein